MDQKKNPYNFEFGFYRHSTINLVQIGPLCDTEQYATLLKVRCTAMRDKCWSLNMQNRTTQNMGFNYVIV